jgi:hypothetical protein
MNPIFNQIPKDSLSGNDRAFGSIYQLIYRGCSYLVEPTVAREVAVLPTTYRLIYRGCPYLVEPNVVGEVAVPPTTYKLIYRGSTY